MNIDVWLILGIISIIALLSSFAIGKNSIWGSMTVAVIIGLVIALVYVFKGESFHWTIIKKAAIVGTLSGVLFEIIARVSGKKKPAADS
ncbi:MAG: hypothetical protein ABIU55_03780 [Ferruginibacter sp.]